MRLSLTLLLIFISSIAMADNGLVTLKSNYDVPTTADRLEKILKAKGMTVFIRIDHAKGAAGAGLKLRPTEVVIFGNPKIGTLLMQCKQSVAIDLPQKMLINEESNGDVLLSYNAPRYLAQRHKIEGCEKALEKVSNALNNFAKAATKKDEQ